MRVKYTLLTDLLALTFESLNRQQENSKSTKSDSAVNQSQSIVHRDLVVPKLVKYKSQKKRQ